MEKNGKYPNLVTKQPPNGFAKLEPVPREKSIAPMISWGDDFLSWPDTRKISYLKGLASTMNHAADLLQNERNDLLKIIRNKEAMIKSLHQQVNSQSNMISQQLNKMNAEKQTLNQIIVELRTEIKTQLAILKLYEDKKSDLK